MNVERFTEKLKTFQDSLDDLYRGASASVEFPSDLLPIAFKELGTASEEMQVAVEQLVMQAEEIAATRSQLEADRQRYQELFEFLPSAYLVTDVHGSIREVNQVAATLLNVQQRFLVGKPLEIFFSKQERQAFPTKLHQLQQRDGVQEWEVCLQPRSSEPVDVVVTVTSLCDVEGKLVSFRWLLEEKRESDVYNLSQSRSRHFYL